MKDSKRRDKRDEAKHAPFVNVPYGRQWIDDTDIEAVVEVLRSDWLTTGPKVREFEEAFAVQAGTQYAIAVSSGTAALHAAIHALGIGSGDEVIVPAMTFAATANAVVFEGGTPVFADVDPATLLLDPAAAQAKITPQTRAIVAVDYAGQPCDYTSLRELCRLHGLALVADASHSLGAREKGHRVGCLADLSTFSFHPVKHITTGEGGMVTTNQLEVAMSLRNFRNHGLTTDHHQRAQAGSWFYQMTSLGYNYRLSDLQCALGTSQLRKLDSWIERRREIAKRYDEELRQLPGVEPLARRAGTTHAYHLYVVRVSSSRLRGGRDHAFSAFRAGGIGVNVHYVPVHLHPYYRKQHRTHIGLCPHAEEAYEQILTLPLFPGMRDSEINLVVGAMNKVFTEMASTRGAPTSARATSE